MPLYESGDEPAARDDAKSLAACVIERRLRKLVSDSLPFQLERHLGVREHDGAVTAVIFGHCKLPVGVELEPLSSFIVSD